MGNEEYKEIMCELYKFLRDKISLSLGEYLPEEAKQKLFSFELDNIVIDNQFNKIIKYSLEDNKIHICDEFLTPEYVKKYQDRNPELDIEKTKAKIANNDPRILLEELICFSGELKIQEKDIIKSLFTQEMLKMLLIKEEMDPKEESVITGTIELVSHNLGRQNGFIVSTPKKLLGELEVAMSLKRELEDKFEQTILGGNVLEYLSNLDNKGLLDKLDDLTTNRRIIESTQNLTNVVDSIATTKTEEVKEVRDEVITITNEVKEEKPIEVVQETNTQSEDKLKARALEEFKSKNKKIFLLIGGVILIVAFGVLVGWLLFKFK